jgi:lipopolysaccharide biosynthesis regulator YciM
MEFEIWWLLGIPVFFALGWIAARVDIKQLLSESRSLPRGYFKGLNLLLNEQPDKAIDAFIEIVKLDPETADMHFALGNLFRRRGEIERAIRVHQNLLARPDLPLEQQVHAQYELGMDYLKAGLLDRAEETFNCLVDTQYGVQARRALLEIFQREKEWRRAIEAAEGLQESGAGARHKEIAQFYCELAQDALVHMQTGRRDGAAGQGPAGRPQERARDHAVGDASAGPGRHRRRAQDLAPRRAAKRAARGPGRRAPDGRLPPRRPARRKASTCCAPTWPKRRRST